LLRSRYVFAESGASHGLVQQRVVSIRILTFLFMFAEMLSRSFLPIYIGTLPEPGLGLAPSLTASIPLTANLLGVACSLPFAGRLSDSIGRRNSYTLGAMILALGLVGAGISGNFYTLLLARTVSGVGYALLFMACQGYVIDNTNENNRSRGIAAFVSAIMVAEICAPAVGGILADRIGYQLVFIFAAFVAVLATMLAIRTLDNQTARARSGSGAQSSALPLLIKNHRFIAISVLAGIPAKLLLGAFLIYLVPVILTELHSSKSEIGRYTVIYGILTLALAPVFARITDRYRAHALMVGAGGLLTGAGLVPILFQASTFNVLVGIAALGLGQAMSISAQLGLVTTVTLKEAQQAGTTAVLGMFRLIERLGGAAGPAIAGALVALLGPVHAMAALGGFGMLTSLAFLIIFFGGKVDLDRAIASSAIPPEDFI
jgi:MFS family permease